MLTKALSLLLVIFLGLALGFETARFVHAHAAGSVAGASGMVNIHRALLGFSLLATSGALLLSLRADSRGGAGAWLSRQWSRFTARLELTLDGLFDFDALDRAGYEACAQDALDDAAKTTCTGCGDRGHWSPDCPAVRPPNAVPCRGCSWCGVDPGDLPDDLWTECDGSGYLPDAKRPLSRTEGKQPDGSYVIEVGSNETHEDVARRHPDVLFVHRENGDVSVTRAGMGPVVVCRREQ